MRLQALQPPCFGKAPGPIHPLSWVHQRRAGALREEPARWGHVCPPAPRLLVLERGARWSLQLTPTGARAL